MIRGSVFRAFRCDYHDAHHTSALVDRGLLFLATVLNYVDRQTLSALAPRLREKFHMRNTDHSRFIFASSRGTCP